MVIPGKITPVGLRVSAPPPPKISANGRGNPIYLSQLDPEESLRIEQLFFYTKDKTGKLAQTDFFLFGAIQCLARGKFRFLMRANFGKEPPQKVTIEAPKSESATLVLNYQSVPRAVLLFEVSEKDPDVVFQVSIEGSNTIPRTLFAALENTPPKNTIVSANQALLRELSASDTLGEIADLLGKLIRTECDLETLRQSILKIDLSKYMADLSKINLRDPAFTCLIVLHSEAPPELLYSCLIYMLENSLNARHNEGRIRWENLARIALKYLDQSKDRKEILYKVIRNLQAAGEKEKFMLITRLLTQPGD